ncbi:MAG: hypothetical protein K5870_04545, partial [Lachnospiraceae bacterium]|nr:hypothetical protein [Lachnospiraceae bacterium]
MNEKVIKAITLGLSAFMALQSPMTVLANSESTGNDPTSASATSTTTSTTSEVPAPLEDVNPGVADAAQEAAKDAATAIVGPQVLAADAGTTTPAPATGAATADAPASTTPAPNPTTTDGTDGTTTPTEPVAESVLDVINAGAATVAQVNTEGSTAKAPSNEQAVEDAAKKLKEDVVEGDGVIQAAAKDVQAAATDVEEIKKDLIVAENAVVASNEAAQDVVDNFTAASDAANLADQAVNKAVSDAQGYIDTINNAGSVPEAQQAKANLDTLITNLTTDMTAKRELFNSAKDSLGKAQQELLDAEADFNASIGKATSEVTDAKNKLDAAQAKVDALDIAVGEAFDDIKTQNAGALSILEKLETVNKDENADWNHQSELLKEILKNYPAMLGEDAKNITIDKYGQKNELPNLSGEYGKYHYFRVTYDVPVKDENGVTVMDENGEPRVESRVKYFNYDRDDKTQAYEDGSSRNIIIYEKSQEEFDAIIYLNNYLKAHGEKMPDNSVVKKNPDAVDGYKVFSYTDAEGNTCYILKKELENNDNFASVTVDGETVYYAKNGEGTLDPDTRVTAVAEPTDEELEALKVGETKQSLVVAPNSVSVSYHLDETNLVKEVKGDYVVTTYTKEVTEPGTNYTKERPSNVLTNEQRKALIDQVESDLAGKLPDGQSVTLKFKEIRDAESNDTYYELTGSYVPLFKIHI